MITIYKGSVILPYPSVLQWASSQKYVRMYVLISFSALWLKHPSLYPSNASFSFLNTYIHSPGSKRAFNKNAFLWSTVRVKPWQYSA
jgi:hypothetical protein